MGRDPYLSVIHVYPNITSFNNFVTHCPYSNPPPPKKKEERMGLHIWTNKFIFCRHQVSMNNSVHILPILFCNMHEYIRFIFLRISFYTKNLDIQI